MHRFELCDTHLGVDAGGFELFVAEELLDKANIRSAFEHVGGAGVAQEVATSGPFDSSLLDELGHHAAEDVGVEAFAVAGEEEGFFVLAYGQFGAAFFEVFLQPVQDAVANGGDAVFVPLPFSDLERYLKRSRRVPRRARWVEMPRGLPLVLRYRQRFRW